MTARRTLFTAATAGALLSALWFVPSAKAAPSPEQRHAAATQAADREDRLADSGGVDTTPYVVGGTASLGLGAGFLAYGVRRERVALR
ncbi:hypothetical protein GCM10018785_27760 [Streptomyces longispororuber]|uniref:Uncharacterized protein n=1 Tax=Streptomyces longispororuber TaxID=68230 RepID=A0A918ZL13_9ACTN|nr:hypothetical protein [Streptomyces longispororuber]GHE56960.1 hypothetical protein GCM10018785_27760 [Streptomyces longispororuber]